MGPCLSRFPSDSIGRLRRPDIRAAAARAEEEDWKAHTLEAARAHGLQRLVDIKPFILDNSALTALEAAEDVGRTLTADDLRVILRGVQVRVLATHRTSGGPSANVGSAAFDRHMHAPQARPRLHAS